MFAAAASYVAVIVVIGWIHCLTGSDQPTEVVSMHKSAFTIFLGFQGP